MLIVKTPGCRLCVRGAREYVRVFTYGSVKLPRSKWLSHAGWGLFVAGDATANDFGPLEDLPHTSYLAELRALVAAVARAAQPISVVCDNKEVVRRFAELLDLSNYGEHLGCPIADNEDPLWHLVWQHLRDSPRWFFHTQWCPSHLLEPGKEAKLDALQEEGGDLNLLMGNRDADALAEKGALIRAPPMYLQQREFIRGKAARIVQTMQVSIWAAF
jgi:ribonuclease HI